MALARYRHVPPLYLCYCVICFAGARETLNSLVILLVRFPVDFVVVVDEIPSVAGTAVAGQLRWCPVVPMTRETSVKRAG